MYLSIRIDTRVVMGYESLHNVVLGVLQLCERGMFCTCIRKAASSPSAQTFAPHALSSIKWAYARISWHSLNRSHCFKELTVALSRSALWLLNLDPISAVHGYFDCGAYKPFSSGRVHLTWTKKEVKKKGKKRQEMKGGGEEIRVPFHKQKEKNNK